MTQEDLLERVYPWIAWREPLSVSVAGVNVTRLCCRYCIAIHGLQGGQVAAVGFSDTKTFHDHLREAHSCK